MWVRNLSMFGAACIYAASGKYGYRHVPSKRRSLRGDTEHVANDRGRMQCPNHEEESGRVRIWEMVGSGWWEHGIC